MSIRSAKSVVEKDTVSPVIYKGTYFITICTHKRQPIFGKIVGAGLAPVQMKLSEIGMIACKQWIETPKRFDNIELNEFVIMPHHIHGIIIIYNPEPSFGQPQGLLCKTLGEIVGAYKTLAAAECLKIYKNNNISIGKFWQRNVYEHIIRNEESYMRLLRNKL